MKNYNSPSAYSHGLDFDHDSYAGYHVSQCLEEATEELCYYLPQGEIKKFLQATAYITAIQGESRRNLRLIVPSKPELKQSVMNAVASEHVSELSIASLDSTLNKLWELPFHSVDLSLSSTKSIFYLSLE